VALEYAATARIRQGTFKMPNDEWMVLPPALHALPDCLTELEIRDGKLCDPDTGLRIREYWCPRCEHYVWGESQIIVLVEMPE
jgi:hypothetical protein